MRATYLGQQWDVAKVRSTPYNTGEVLHAALEVGVQPYGNWSGCHSIAWDAAAPPTGDRELTNLFSKQSYPLGIVVNRDARRFIDEGADFRDYTYTKYGAEILRQPAALAYQIFDAKTRPLLRDDEYNALGVSRYEPSTVWELGEMLGLYPEELWRTVEEFNASIRPDKFDSTARRATHALNGLWVAFDESSRVVR